MRKIRPLCFVLDCLRSAGVPPAGDRVSRSRTCSKLVLARRQNQHARRVCYPIRFAILFFLVRSVCRAAETTSVSPNGDQLPEAEPVVVSATRFVIPLDQSPASTTVIPAEDLEQKQIQRVSDALREVPGLAVLQTGTPGQLTSVFTRGLNSAHTQVLIDGIPINQGLAGQFDFANLTTDNIDRIEVVRGPQSTIYGPRALAGAIQIFTKQGMGAPGLTTTAEGGTYGTFRETLASDGKIDLFDYSIGVSRLDTDNARPNNQYRNTAGITDLGLSLTDQLRIGSLFMYSLSDTGNPNSTLNPRPLDNFLTEKWLIGPHIDWKPVDWWEHRLIFDYDHERQLNDPNQDGFLGPTRALFRRTQVDYQNNLRPTAWLTLTDGFFFSHVESGEERPFVSQQFGFQPKFISDQTTEIAGYLEATLAPVHNLIFVAGGRVDHFNQFGDIWTYRIASSYKLDRTDTTLHASVATGFSPPSSQDKIFGNNFGLEPEKDFGWDAGFEQRLWNRRLSFGATYFHNDLSNVIGFNGLFETLNLGAAETQGIETDLRAMPIENLTLQASYTYLEAEKTDSSNILQPQGARLPRRPRNEIYISASYLWCKKLRTAIEAKWVNAREEINFGGPNFDVEDYNFVNIAAEYEINPHLSVYGKVDNLTGEHYSEVHELVFIGPKARVSDFPALGTACYGGMKLRF